MNTRGLLDNSLQSGNQFLQKHKGSGQINQFLSGAGGGALAGTAVGLLLGNKKVRNMGGSVLKYGGVAALGAVAFKAYQNWQSSNATAPQTAPQTVDKLPAAEVETHSEAILMAMLNAAKADGHIDAQERQLIDAQIADLTSEPEVKQWVDQQLQQPVDPIAVAKYAKTPEMAAEMYLASLLMLDEQSFMEKTYLDELARQMNIDDSLKAEIHAAKEQATA